ncbi:unnamed protein product [Mucor hiemalis]
MLSKAFVVAMDKIENSSPASIELEKAVSNLKLAETIYEETTKRESVEYVEQTSELAKKLSLLIEKKTTLKTKIEEKERRIEQIAKANKAESETKVLHDLEDSRTRVDEVQKREHMLKDKLEKSSRLLEQIRREKAHKKLIAEEKEQFNAVVLRAAIKYTGLSLVIESVDTIKFEYKFINGNDPEEIYYFTLHLAESGTYELIECNPPLPTIEAHFKKVNADRDLYVFIKAIRKDFVKYLNKLL